MQIIRVDLLGITIDFSTTVLGLPKNPEENETLATKLLFSLLGAFAKTLNYDDQNGTCSITPFPIKTPLYEKNSLEKHFTDYGHHAHDGCL